MGYGVTPYSVNVNVLRSPHTYTQDPEDFLAWIQDRFCKDDEDEEYEYGPTRQSMREMFFDQPLTGTEGLVYGNTLRAFCDTFGGMLGNGHWYPVGFSWFDTVRDALAQVGVSFDPNDLIYSGSPVTMPPIDDFPCIGYLERDEALSLAEQLDAADLSAIGDQKVTGSIREMVIGSIRELHGWLKQCKADGEHETDNYDLVCFYS
ncbi:DUF7691 family protein [Actinomadura rugatobispora]|uniref:DUF7691 domain-containing protein n=1 Tax=Actinomadura rugatobispora TaxID=1994 RepID=A0ABW1A5E1_9ACTN|nr:hypothetical protein GCM10010200_042300 [Actinomadura rugatobispora]